MTSTGKNVVADMMSRFCRTSSLLRAWITCQSSCHAGLSNSQKVMEKFPFIFPTTGSTRKNNIPASPHNVMRRRNRSLKNSSPRSQRIAITNTGRKPTSAQFSVSPAP